MSFVIIKYKYTSNNMGIRKLEVDYDVVFVIDCLLDSERKDWEITNDLLIFLASKGVKQTSAKCNTKNQFFDFLSYLKNEAQKGNKFCIHIVGHGNRKSLLISESNEAVFWSELRSIFNEINSYLNGTLFINMSTCFGLNAIQIVDENNPELPFFGLIGYSEKLQVVDAKYFNKIFYGKLLLNTPVNQAIEEIRKENDKFYCASAENYQVIKLEQKVKQ